MAIIYNFIESRKTNNGCGLLKGNYLASDLARTLTKNQIRNYERRGILPPAFIMFAQELLEPRYSRLFNRMSESTFWAICEALYNKDAGKYRVKADYLRKSFLSRRYSQLNRSFGSQEHIWKEVERIQPGPKDMPCKQIFMDRNTSGTSSKKISGHTSGGGIDILKHLKREQKRTL